MNRIDAAFERTRRENRAALIPFITCGDPDLETTLELVPELERAGADIIELGFAHSDPIAEGPTIQAASLRALRHGTGLQNVLETVSEIRKVSEVPLILMGYLNNVLSYGAETLVKSAAQRGADGLIVVDAPYEEVPELQAACEANQLHRILLVAPTSTPERVVHVAEHSAGFIYCVSTTGVTGERRDLPEDLPVLIARIQRVSSTPVGVGFGISSAEHAAQVAKIADAVVVGSALVRRIGAAGSRAEVISSSVAFVSELSEAVRGARKAGS